MTDTFVYTNADHAAVTSATKITYSRYRQYVDYADVQQELYLWLFINYSKAEGWREQYAERHAERTVVRALRRAGERYARKEKAEQCGYAPEDEFFYSIPMCADLLQLYFDPEWMMPAGQDLTEDTVGGKPASESGDLMTMVADVGRAYEAQPAADKELLAYVYNGERVVSDAIASLSLDWECTYSAANSRIRRVMGRVREKLGGPNPWREEE